MRLTSQGIALALALAGGAFPGAAFATVGGPTLCEVLGWDAREQRVYVHEIPTDGGDSFGPVRYFALAGAEPTRALDVGWSRPGEGTLDDPVQVRELVKLRARLAPLRLVPASALPLASTVVATDSVKAWDATRVRYRVRVTFDLRLEFEVLAFDAPTVVRTAEYVIPGRAERLIVLAFIGQPFEGDYEVQIPLLVRADERGIRKVEGAAGE